MKCDIFTIFLRDTLHQLQPKSTTNKDFIYNFTSISTTSFSSFRLFDNKGSASNAISSNDLTTVNSARSSGLSGLFPGRSKTMTLRSADRAAFASTFNNAFKNKKKHFARNRFTLTSNNIGQKECFCWCTANFLNNFSVALGDLF